MHEFLGIYGSDSEGWSPDCACNVFRNAKPGSAEDAKWAVWVHMVTV